MTGNGDGNDNDNDDRDRGDGETPRTVHDAMFKRLFSVPELAAQELRAVLPPPLVASVNWSAMTAMPTSFVDAVFHQRNSDLVYQAHFLDGGEVIFWLLEHQSSEDWWMLERILETMLMMWRRWRKLNPEARRLPVIVPVVVYNGPRPWRAPRDMYELYGLSETLRAALGPHVLSCTLIIDDLCAIDDEALRARRMDAYARLCLFSMARAAAEDFLDRIQGWQVELQLVFGAGDAEDIEAFLLYTWRVHRHTDPGTVRKHIAAVAGPKHEDAMLSVYEQLIKQGFDKGLEKGLESGREQERRAMLVRLLGRRFGTLPEPVTTRVAAASTPELERWFDRALDAASLDDVFASE